MSEVIFRQIEMLRLLPHAPRKIDSSTLRQRLIDAGFEVSSRTVQRDLQELSLYFPVSCDDQPGHYGWCWEQHAKPVTLSSMSPQVAMTFALVQQFLPALLPDDSVRHLESYFKAAEGALRELKNDAFIKWRDKVRVVSSTHRMLPPEVSESVAHEVYQALFADRQLALTYNTAKNDLHREATVSPLGLIIREPVIYLLCTFWDYRDIRMLPLHRIHTAVMLEDPVQVRDPVQVEEPFSLDRYIEENHQDIELVETIDFRAKIDHQQARYLQETPIASGQQLHPLDNGMFLLSATLRDTVQFRRWILSLTGSIEVLEPARLRSDIAGFIAKQHGSYINS